MRRANEQSEETGGGGVRREKGDRLCGPPEDQCNKLGQKNVN